MAKPNIGNATPNKAAFAHLVAFASIIWFKEFNLARQTGNYGKDADSKKLLDLLVEHDWLLDDNGMLKVERLPDDLRERATKEREEAWESLKHQAKLDSEKQIDLNLFEKLYCDKGKVLVPEYLGISGNRRSTVAFQAKVARRKQNLPVGNQIPVIIYAPSSPIERLRIQCDENEFKLQGFLEMSNEDRLLAAKNVFQMGGKESDLASMFKRGMSQKLFGIVRLDAKYPSLDIVKRMCLPVDNPLHIAWGVDKEDLRILFIRSDEKELEAYNLKQLTAGKEAIKAATQEDVERYLKVPHGTNGNKTKIMSRDTIENLSKNFPNVPMRAAFAAIMANNVDLLKSAQMASNGYNALGDIIANGDYPPLEELLTKILDAGKNRGELLAKLLSNCS